MLQFICAVAALAFAIMGTIFVASGLYGLVRENGKQTDGAAALVCFMISFSFFLVAASFAWLGGWS